MKETPAVMAALRTRCGHPRKKGRIFKQADRGVFAFAAAFLERFQRNRSDRHCDGDPERSEGGSRKQSRVKSLMLLVDRHGGQGRLAMTDKRASLESALVPVAQTEAKDRSGLSPPGAAKGKGG